MGPGSGLALEHEEVGERGLGPLNLRRKDGLLPHVHVQEEGGIWENRRNSVKAAQGDMGLLKERLNRGIQLERRRGGAADSV